MRKRWILYILILLVLVPLAFVQPRSGAESAVANYQPPITRKELLRLVNEERATQGLKPMVLDERLNRSGQKKAIAIQGRDVYTENLHLDANGRIGYELITEEGAKCYQRGENIAFTEKDAKDVVVSWTNSPKHNEVMNNPVYNITGFGIKGKYIVEHFCML